MAIFSAVFTGDSGGCCGGRQLAFCQTASLTEVDGHENPLTGLNLVSMALLSIMSLGAVNTTRKRK